MIKGKTLADSAMQIISDDFKPMFGEPISDWYRYFAWRPILTWDRGYRWLTLVWKRKCQPHSYLPGLHTPFYQYRVSHPIKQSKDERNK